MFYGSLVLLLFLLLRKEFRNVNKLLALKDNRCKIVINDQ